MIGLIADALALIGLSLIAIGVWLAFGEAATLIVVGAVLLLAGVVAALRRTHVDPR